MSVHSIRLAGPWEEQHGNADDMKVQLPYSLSEARESVGLRRHFHRPSGLSEASRVRIALTAEGCPLQIAVNGQRMEPTIGTGENRCVFDVTDHLDSFNTLDVKITRNSPRLTAAVLEIIEP